MPTPTGTIKASDIANEFGSSGINGKVSLGNYRVNQTVSELTLPLDTGVPNPGSAISFGNLRGKKLNIVVDCTAPLGEWKTSVNGKQEYDSNNNITVIGGFTTKPNSPAGKKVWIHTNGNIGGGIYLSRGSKGVQCTYDVYVGDFCDDNGFCYPQFVSTTSTYGQLHFYAEYSEFRTTSYSLENRYYIRLFRRQESGTTLLYRLHNNNTLDYLYSLDPNEGTGSGYNLEGPIGYVYSSDGPNRTPVWRLYCVYDPPAGSCSTIIDRFLTTDPNERPGGYTVDNNGNPAFWMPSVNTNPSSTNSCSLSTGSWDYTTDLIVNIGPSGRVYGSGGDGGWGGNQGSNGNNGGTGTSAIGVNVTNSTTIQIASGAVVYGGGGGGGGGGGAQGVSVNRGKGFITNAGGGGGGGGQGYPGGAGSKGGLATDPGTPNKSWSSGGEGGNASLSNGGSGGGGGSATLGDGCQAFGGGGGGGGFAGSAGNGGNGNNGTGGSISKGGDGSYGQGVSSKGYASHNTSGGGGGPSGHGIVVNTSSANVTYINNGSVNDIVYNTSPS